VVDFASYIGGQTLAVSVKTSAAPQGEFVVDSDVNEIPLKIAIKRV
jgi:isoleucyl-tRNA synthetase